jgi:HEAT repeat protein
MFGTSLHEVAAYENLQLQVEEKARRFGTRGAQEVRDETGERDRDQLEAAGADAGPEVIAMGWLRSSAAIALGELEVPRAGDALLRFLDEDTKRHPSYETPMGFAIMSLAAYPTEQSRDKLITILGKNDPAGKMRLDVARDAPRRGFAALALGLYARPEKTEQGLTDRPKFDWAITTLAERLDDDREEEEIRTACAVGLGLTQRADVLPMLQKTGAKLEQRGRRGDQAVLGFIFLGRALAGDKSHVDIAGKFILGKDDVTPSGILARRATVLSLGLTRSATTIPVLTKAWHLNHYVNREVILALRLVGGANAATPVMERLRQAKDPEERAYMADALGELLAVERPTALSRLTAGSNYTVRNDYLLPHQSLANGFLFDYLIASLGEK